ncbi:hypothetical protein FA15DRAFT_120865 [Coprinopsis marcescibilis]|uniref:Uncharacterized protein n=1 Tax=Coprinopsis marcescibilis TaxID=230819 RepID=A0A5C3L5F2_COPMA|nr:hypothetical protein FA15DRAFT_120865 [Coprinopsis marcescibilis]
MKSWNVKLRKLKPLKRFNDRIRLIKNNILESTCLPFAGELECHASEPVVDHPVSVSGKQRLAVDGSGAVEAEMREIEPTLPPVAGTTSWLGVFPYDGRSPFRDGRDDDVGVIPQEDGQRQYHYRLRRIQFAGDESVDAPFITPIPSVRLDTPHAPKKSDGTSRYYSLLDRGLISTSFDEFRPLPLDGTLDGRVNRPARYPKLEAIFGQDQDSLDVSDPRRTLFPEAHPHRFGSSDATGSDFKFIEETVRDSTEVFMHAGIEPPTAHSYSGGSSDTVHSTKASTRDLNDISASNFYHHHNESIFHLPSIESDAASFDAVSPGRYLPFDGSESSNSSFVTSQQDNEEMRPISVSISKQNGGPDSSSGWVSTSRPAALPMVPPNTPWNTQKVLAMSTVREPQNPDARNQRRLSGNSEHGEGYSFISFATPHRISLSSWPDELGPNFPLHIHPREFVTPVAKKTALRQQTTETRSAMSYGDRTVRGSSGKSVRIYEHGVLVVTDRKPSLPAIEKEQDTAREQGLQSSSFTRNLNKALDALEKVAESDDLVSGLPYMSGKASPDGKGAANGSDLAALPPSALLSPVSKFSEGEFTLASYNDEYDHQPAATYPRRRRRFGLPVGKQNANSNGVPLSRTKTRDSRDSRRSQGNAIYRKFLDMYSLQYQYY